MKPYIYNTKTSEYRPYVSFAHSILSADELANLDTSKPAEPVSIDELRNGATLAKDEVLVDVEREVYDEASGKVRPFYRTALERVEELSIAVEGLAERVSQLEVKVEG